MLPSNELINSISSVSQALNKHQVEYIIIGGTAVAYYGYFRHSIAAAGIPAEKPDVNIWYNSTYANYFRLLEALSDLGLDVTTHQNEQSPNPRKSFFRYEFQHFTLDLLPQIKAILTFNTAYPRREINELNGVAVPIIHFEDLITDKRAMARSKDLVDIEQLRKHSNNSQGQ